jgi:hypothetical protein
MSSVTKQVMDAIITGQRRITTANGFHNNVAFVTKKRHHASKISSVPVVIVERGMSRTEAASEDRALRKTERAFHLYGYTKWDADNNDEGKGSDVADELEEDIVEALYQTVDTVLGIDGVKVVEISTLEPTLDEERCEGWVGVAVSMEYYHGDDV